MELNFDDLQDPDERYEFENIVGFGVYGKVYAAVDTQASNKRVAIKLQRYEENMKTFLEEEYKVLRDFSNHVNIIDFYGVFRKGNEIWFVLEPCDGGPVIDLVIGLMSKNRRMNEDHIAYILKEVVKALIFLQENRVIHRDVKGSNILLTSEGEVKMCDFGLAKRKSSEEEKFTASLGSPCWMAPEVIEPNSRTRRITYDERVDVWSLGITAIELAEGKAPFQDMHPTRALFQIARNPPLTLKSLSYWTNNYHDFVNECLVKEYEYRPYIMEIIEHPFLQEIPENNYHLSLEIKSLLQETRDIGPVKRAAEMNVCGKLLKKSIDEDMEPMYEEDFAALRLIAENDILELLERRMMSKEYYTFIGDILLFLNPNEKLSIFGPEFHVKYHSKSRSDNAPHIYAVADTVYQNALHHVMPQQIVLSGETGSGKTTNYLHLIDHLFYIGNNTSINSSRMKNAIKLIHSFIHASTPWNSYSTRAIFKTQVMYGRTGKLSAASFNVHCLEKGRISSSDMVQGNFQIIYYVYDGLVSRGIHEVYRLEPTRNYNFLRIRQQSETKELNNNIKTNTAKFKKISNFLEELEFTEEQISAIHSVIAAILNLGETRFEENEDTLAIIVNRDVLENVAVLLDVDEKKMNWALTNYCLIKGGNAIRKRNTCEEARDARNVLANTLYSRLVDYVVNMVNSKLAFGKAIFGAKYFVNILDYFGFECFQQNAYAQLLVNCFNEQMHYHFLQRVFTWEMQDLANEDIEFRPVSFYNNKETLNELLGKSEGLFSIVDDASKKGFGGRYITENVQNEEKQKITVCAEMKFSIAHYTGKVTYNCREMPEKNRDFLPPEIIETMRSSQNAIINMMFTNKLDRTGNLIMPAEDVRSNRFNFVSKQAKNKQYSQIKRMRTQATIFRSLCLDLLKELSIGSGSGGSHFIKCIRSDLKGRPDSFQKGLVRQQVRAMAVVPTAKARKYGYSQRISFPEFLRRYKFLAFDFDETVDLTSENCRLLMIRLKMEGWAIGKSKIFLKYYNEEFLSRLYETQVTKIIKIQSILRGFLTKCKLKKQIKEQEKQCIGEINKRRRSSVMTEDQAAEIIQKAYRKNTKRKELMEMYEELEEQDLIFIRPFALKWKNNSIFSVLMRYKNIKLQDFFNFAQQVHFYNMASFHNLQNVEGAVELRDVDQRANVSVWLGAMKTSVMKILFRLDEIPFYDTSNLCDYFTNIGNLSDKEDSWDTPYRWRESKSQSKDGSDSKSSETPDAMTNIDFSRDPDDPILELPQLIEDDVDIEIRKLTNEESRVSMFSKTPAKERTAPISTRRINVENKNTINDVKSKLDQPPPFQGIQLRKVGSSYKADQENFINSAPANKDFNYIKTSPVTVKPKYAVDPVAELRHLAKRGSNASDDDPPFNFQGMLRKTNIRRDSRDSLKNALQAVRRFSLPKNEISRNGNVIINGNIDEEPITTRQVSMQILPGLIMEGIEVDL